MEEIEAQIKRHKEYMRIREIGHDLYYTDPNGRDKDCANLRELERQLEEIRSHV